MTIASRTFLWSSSSVGLEFVDSVPSFASQSSTTFLVTLPRWQSGKQRPSLSSCVRNPGIAQSWVIPWMASAKHGSTLYAGQSTDCANPCFAPNISIMYNFLPLYCYGAHSYISMLCCFSITEYIVLEYAVLEYMHCMCMPMQCYDVHCVEVCCVRFPLHDNSKHLY